MPPPPEHEPASPLATEPAGPSRLVAVTPEAEARRLVAMCSSPAELADVLAGVARNADLYRAVLEAAHAARGNTFVAEATSAAGAASASSAPPATAASTPAARMASLLPLGDRDLIDGFAAWTTLAADIATFSVEQHAVLAQVVARLPSKHAAAHPILREVFAACTDDGAATMEACLERRFDVDLIAKKKKADAAADVPALGAWTPASMRRMWLDLASMPAAFVEHSRVLGKITRSPVAPGETTHGTWDPSSSVLSLAFDEGLLATLDSDRVASKGDPLHDTNFFDHAVRHEVGHAVDDVNGFSDHMAASPIWGAWKKHWRCVDAVMEGCGLTATLDKRPRKKVTALLEAAFAAPTVAPDVSGVELEPDLLTLVQQAIVVLQRMAIAKKGAWKEDAAADQAIAGRVYTYNDYYGEVYSFDEAALGRKLSNYQFYAPGEYFAEAFAAYYEPTAEGRGALLAGDPALRAWFDEHVHGKATGAPGTPPR